MHILLGSDISSDQLALADQLLPSSYQHMPDLYGEESCKMNIHYLVHLVSFVRMWDPLWICSCFGFENMSGHLICSMGLDNLSSLGEGRESLFNVHSSQGMHRT